MDASGQYHPTAGRESVQAFSSSQMPQYSQSSSIQREPPLFSPMFATMPLQPAMSPMPATHISLQQALGLHPAVMNNVSPAMSLPGPSTPAAASQAIATFHHGPMAEAQPEVVFDPGTPPPFADRAQMQTPRRHGVLKITNIPYTISIPEMHQFIGRYLPTNHLIDAHITGYPTHIIMERSTGKTMDCYMELKSPETAAADWEHAFGTQQMRIPKIGQRNVEVTISTQSELMREIFPRAKCIHWDNDRNGAPNLVANRDVYSSGFNGFITTEELTCMARHAENPQRSQFAARSMNRAYECMISTTYKFPWFAASLYTLRQSQEIFKCYKKQLDHLIGRLTSPNMPREVGLDNKLLMDLIFAGLNTPGFSERQKGFIADTCVVVGTGFPVSKHARAWPFQTLSLYPTKLSEQDVGMWLEILSIGMGVLEMQGRPFIGISSYLQVTRDIHGQILFLPTEEGLDLKRAQFSILETRMMRDLMDYGWSAYLPQMGIEPSIHATNNSFLMKASRVAASDPSVIVGSAINPGTGAYTVDENGNREPDGASTYNIEEDVGFIQAGDTGMTSDSFNDPEQALAAMRQVVDGVREAPPVDQAEASAVNLKFDPEVDGLGAGLNNIRLNNHGDPNVARYVPPARRTSNYPILQPAANLDPESPAFEPPVTRPQQDNGPAPPAGPAFAGTGLGNGDFTTSSPHNSTRRDSSTASNSTVDKNKGKESALTAPAAGVRLQPAPVLGTAFVPHAGQGQAFPQGRVLTYGQTQGQGGQAASVIQAIASRAAQRRGITIRDHRGNIVTAPRPAAPIESSAGGVNAGTDNASTAPGTVLPFNYPRSRPGNTCAPNHGTDGTGRTFDDTLDEWFDEKTDEPTRMAISAGMNMRTASAATLAAPSTPPPRPGPALHRSPAREHLRTGYEFDETLHMRYAERMPVAPPARPFGTASAPVTPAQPVVRTPRQNVAPTPSSMGYRTLSTINRDSTGGVRLPRSVTTGNFNAATPTPNFGVVGDGSPMRRHNINITQTNLPDSPLPLRYAHGGSSPEKLALRMAIHREAILHRYNIGEEDE